MKKILVIVPHQDDEVNVLGNVLHRIRTGNFVTAIAFVTNGDYDPELTKTRYKEASKVAKYLNVNHVYFLGYGDNLDGKSLYCGNKNEVIPSHAGHTETYSAGPVSDFRYLKSGFHSEYTRNNLLKDMKELILDVSADCIICVDCDRHPDHIMTSLIFEEAMKEIVIQRPYHPVVLKKYAYLGAWYAEDDYFDSPAVQPTEDSVVFPDVALRGEKAIFPYQWSERIRFQSDETIVSRKYWASALYKCLCLYKSQNALSVFPKVANSDGIYWYRDTNNLALCSQVSASSGVPGYVNDFKLVDYENINQLSSGIPQMCECAWKPDSGDLRPFIQMKFGQSKTIKHIRIHQGTPDGGAAKSVRVLLDNDVQYQFDLYHRYVNDLYIGDTVFSAALKIEFNDYDTAFCVREIEVFDHISEYPWGDSLFEKWNGHIRTNREEINQKERERFWHDVEIREKRWRQMKRAEKRIRRFWMEKARNENSDTI